MLGEAALSLVSGGVLFVILSRIAGPELLGTYALALAWLTVFQGISSFGVPEFLLREVGAHGRSAAKQVTHAMLLGLGTGCIGTGLMLSAVRMLGYPADLVQVMTVTSFALIPAFLNMACRSVFLALRQMHLTFLTFLAEVLIMMLASVYLLLSGYGAVALMVTLVVAKLLSSSIAVSLLYGRVLPARLSLDIGFLMRTAATVFIFGLGGMLGMMTMRISTIMVSLWVDIAAVGQFAAATKTMEIGLIAPSLFAQLLMTHMAHSFNTQRDFDPNRFGPWYQLMLDLVIPSCVGVWVFGGLVLHVLFGPGFDGALWTLRILAVYLAIESIDALMSVMLLAMHRQREDATRLAFNPLVNILLNLILLPLLGITGAAVARVGGVATSATLRNLFIARISAGVRWHRYALKPALISIGTGLCCIALEGSIGPAWLLLIYTVATFVLLNIFSSLSPAAVKAIMRPPSSGG